MATRSVMGMPRPPFDQTFPGGGGTDGSDPASQMFDQFCCANTFQGIMDSFSQLCRLVGLRPSDHRVFYHQLKTRLNSWKAQTLWVKLDKRSQGWEYGKGLACSNTSVLVIGSGPCGLRIAIEAALLGCKVVVVEKRDGFSRNNVLHLWPFLIYDLKILGAKKFFGKFCAGSIDHISIRTLQCILLKVSLLVGVEIHSRVTFEGFLEPPVNQNSEKIGWRARVTPSDHPVSEFVFDVCISSDGKRNTMQEFRRKEFRGKLAIAITANFINRNTKAEASVEEISGVAYIFNQKFFKDLNQHAGIDLENIVYYKDETHYFVMTAKKQSLLCKGVLLQDYDDPEKLLSKDNVDQQALLTYAREAADLSTQHQLPNLEFAHNQYGQPDVAMFDFTSMFAAENACRVLERQGHKLLIGLVGDTLLEPFWPTGSGCARGFLGAFDAAWMIRSWASGKMTPLEVMAERESIYQLLSQTTPENLNKNYLRYTIDPNTRYLNLHSQFFRPNQVRSQYDGTDMAYLDAIIRTSEEKSKRYDALRDSHNLLKWCQKQLESYHNLVKVADLSGSWRSGIALAALIHRYHPELLDVYSLDPNRVEYNNQLVFDVAEKHFGIASCVTGRDMAQCDVPDRLIMTSYLSAFYEYFVTESAKQIEIVQTQLPKQHISALTKIGNKIRQRREELERNDFNSLKRNKADPSPDVPSKRIRDLNRLETARSIYNRFEDVDYLNEDLSRCTNVGEELKVLTSGVRGQNKVSALAKDLASKFSGESLKPFEEVKQNPKPLILGKTQPGDVCYFCKNRVYIVERYTAEGLNFHRNCFRCDYCSSPLRISCYSFQRNENGEGKFYCVQHHGLQRPEKNMPRRNNNDQPDAPIIVSPPKLSATSEHYLQCPERQYLHKKTPERVEYMTESEVEESEFDQTRHNLIGAPLRSSAYSDSDSSSSEEELQFSIDDGSDEEPDMTWIELAKNYSKHLQQTRESAKVLRKRNSSNSSGSDTETMGASDADYETDTETEKENLSENINHNHQKNLPAEDLVKKPASKIREGFSKQLLSLDSKQKTIDETKPSPTSVEITRNRMAFFSAVAQPVRIDARVFLGLDPKQQKIAEEAKQAEVVAAEEILAKNVDEESKNQEETVEEAVVDQNKEQTGHGNKKKKVKAKKWTKRRKKDDKNRVTVDVVSIPVVAIHEAVPIVSIAGATSSEEDEKEKRVTSKTPSENPSKTPTETPSKTPSENARSPGAIQEECLSDDSAEMIPSEQTDDRMDVSPDDKHSSGELELCSRSTESQISEETSKTIHDSDSDGNGKQFPEELQEKDLLQQRSVSMETEEELIIIESDSSDARADDQQCSVERSTALPPMGLEANADRDSDEINHSSDDIRERQSIDHMKRLDSRMSGSEEDVLNPSSNELNDDDPEFEKEEETKFVEAVISSPVQCVDVSQPSDVCQICDETEGKLSDGELKTELLEGVNVDVCLSGTAALPEKSEKNDSECTVLEEIVCDTKSPFENLVMVSRLDDDADPEQIHAGQSEHVVAATDENYVACHVPVIQFDKDSSAENVSKDAVEVRYEIAESNGDIGGKKENRWEEPEEHSGMNDRWEEQSNMNEKWEEQLSVNDMVSRAINSAPIRLAPKAEIEGFSDDDFECDFDRQDVIEQETENAKTDASCNAVITFAEHGQDSTAIDQTKKEEHDIVTSENKNNLERNENKEVISETSHETEIYVVNPADVDEEDENVVSMALCLNESLKTDVLDEPRSLLDVSKFASDEDQVEIVEIAIKQAALSPNLPSSSAKVEKVPTQEEKEKSDPVKSVLKEGSSDHPKKLNLDPLLRMDMLLESLSSNKLHLMDHSLAALSKAVGETDLVKPYLECEVRKADGSIHAPVSEEKHEERPDGYSFVENLAEEAGNSNIEAGNSKEVLEFFVEDEAGVKCSFSVDEKSEENGCRARDLSSDSSFLTTSTTHGSVEFMNFTSEPINSPMNDSLLSDQQATGLQTTEDNSSADWLATTSFNDDSLSNDINPYSEDLPDVDVDVWPRVVLDHSPAHDILEGEVKDFSGQKFPGHDIKKRPALTVCLDSASNKSNDNQSKTVTAPTNLSSNSLDRKSIRSNMSANSTVSSIVSPNKIIDAKRRFFCEPPQPLRIDHIALFRDIPTSKPQPPAVTATPTLKETGCKPGDDPGVDKISVVSEKSSIPGTSNDNIGSVLPSENPKSKTKFEEGTEAKNGSELVPRRVLPTTPNQPSSTADAAKPEKTHVVQEKTDEKTANVGKSELVFDENLVLRGTKKALLKEKKRPNSAFIVLEENWKIKSKGSPSNANRPTSAKPISSEKEKDLLRHKGVETNLPLVAVCHSDGASAEEASPNILRKDKESRLKAFYNQKSKSKDSSSQSSSKDGKEDKKEKEGKEDKKEKKKSLLSLLMSSKSVDKKEKGVRSPPVLTKSTSKPIEEKPVKTADAMQIIKEKTKSLPLEKRQSSEEGKKFSHEKPSSKVKQKNKVGKVIEEDEKGSVYKEMAPIIEGIKRVEKRNKDKNSIRERIEAVAPPPAKSPNTVLLPPKADIDDFEMESEFGDDRMSVRSFHSQMQPMSEEDLVKLKKRQQKQARRKQKEKELKRLHIAQEIQRQLEEVEMRQREVEMRGVTIEKTLRGEGSDQSRDEASLMQEWFDVVQEKNILTRYESELAVQARELELEDRQSRLQLQLQERIPLNEAERNESIKEEEQRILQELMEVVEQRDKLVALLEEDRLKQQQYDRNLERIMVERGYQMSPISIQQFRRMSLTAALRDDELAANTS